MKMKFKKGFTLIELLVVIAIIGILSGIVLASLNSVRDKAKATAIKATLGSMRVQAEVVFDNDGDYDGVCADPQIVTMLADVTSNGGTHNCDDAVGAWATEVTMPDTTLYCVDSTTYAGVPSATKVDATVCTQ